MAEAPTFPLLPLPHLARVHIIKLMDIPEQYHLSTLSKKSKKLVKICYIPCILHMQLKWLDRLSREHAVLYISKDQKSVEYSILIATNDYVSRPCDRIYDVVLKVENWREVAIEQLEFVNEQFRILRFETQFVGVPNDITKQFLGDVKELRIDIYQLLLDSCEEVNDEMYKWIMDECADVKRLSNSYSITRECQWNSDKPLTFERCYIDCAPFLTLDHLTRLFWSCKCFQAEDDEHKMTSQDFNKLVKLWMGGDSKLEFLWIGVTRSINFREVMMDIEKVPVQSAHVENNLEIFREGRAFKIKQKNGMEAVVCLSHGIYFTITTHFNERDCDFWDDDEEDEE